MLEGGGIKGLGLVGAVLRLMQERYTFPRVAGTSAGAIVAAFIAADIDADGLADVMDRLDYSRVPDRSPPGIPVVSEGVSLLSKRGAYEGDYVREFVYEELKQLGVTTFGDLRRSDAKADRNTEPYQRYKLVVMATDVTRGRLLRLPWDYRLLHLDPDEQVVADAVRASMSIPLYFEPVTLRDGQTGAETTLVDGGCCRTSRSRSSTGRTRRTRAGRRSGSRSSPSCPPETRSSSPASRCPSFLPSTCSSRS